MSSLRLDGFLKAVCFSFLSLCHPCRSTYGDFCSYNQKHLIGVEVCDYFGMQAHALCGYTDEILQFWTCLLLPWRWNYDLVSRLERGRKVKAEWLFLSRKSWALLYVRLHAPPSTSWLLCCRWDADLPQPSLLLTWKSQCIDLSSNLCACILLLSLS